jgi:hypothetical protein
METRPMTWNYRVIRHVGPGDRVSYRIHEVYYEGDQVVTVTEEAVTPSGEEMEDLKEQFEQMKTAFEKPILDYSDL